MSFDPGASVVGDAVHFHMHFVDGPGPAAVSVQALQQYFGADATEETLLAAYRANYRSIHAVAQQRHANGATRPVRVDAADLGGG